MPDANKPHTVLALPLAITIAALLLVACSNQKTAPDEQAQSEPAQQTESPSLAIFDPTIERQRRRPDQPAMQAPPPPGLPDNLTEPLPERLLERARTPLQQVLEDAALEPRPRPTEPDLSATTLSRDEIEALTAFTAGRAALDILGAVAAEPDLRRAARFDPDAPEPWSALAQAQEELGSPQAAQVSYQRVLDRDPDNIDALFRLADAALDARDYKLATRHFARLTQLALRDADPALPNIVYDRIAQCCNAQGFFAAGAEASIKAADLPDSFSEPTEYFDQLSRIYRQRLTLILAAGDAFARVQLFERAAQAYALADNLSPTYDTRGALARRVYAFMRIGHSARAADAVVTQIIDGESRVNQQVLGLIEHIAAYSSVQDLLARALGEQLDAARASNDAIADAHLALACANALPPERATEVLRRSLADHPAHSAALRALLARLPEPEQRVAETTRLLRAHPHRLSDLADALLGAHPPSTFLEVTPETDPAGALLRAYLLLESARLTDAVDALKPITTAHESLFWEACVLRATIYRMLAREDLASQQLDRLPPPGQSIQSDYARARTHMVLAQISRARAILRPHLDQLLTSLPEAHNTLAFITSTLGDNIDARAMYEQAIAARTLDDTPYRRLLALLRPRAVLADPQAYNDMYRDLRDRIPWSAGILFERAVSDVQSGRVNQAIEELRVLLERHPREHTGALLLADLMVQRTEFDEASRMLRDRVEWAPMETGLYVRLGRILSEQEQPEEAAELLADRLAAVPGDNEVSELLEAILRSELDRGAEADELALERMRRMTLAPDQLLDLFAVYVQRERKEAAAETLGRYLENEDIVGRPISSELVQILASAHQRVVDRRRDTALGVRSLVEKVFGAYDELPWGMHQMRLNLVAIDETTSRDTLAVLESAHEAYPDRLAEMVQQQLSALSMIGQSARTSEDFDRAGNYFVRALDVAAYNARQSQPPTTDQLGIKLVSALQLASLPDYRDSGADTIREVWDTAEQSNRLDDVVERAARPFGGEPRAFDVAQFCYSLAVLLNGSSQDELCEPAYRLLLKYNPDHAMAMNNLGYRMVERNADLEEAHRLLTRAHELRHGEDGPEAIIDSLGWVRYKLGMVEDGAEANGRQIPGAKTLLGEARRLANETAKRFPRSGVVFDMTVAIVAGHHGDALWVLGEREDAVQAWQESYDFATKVLASDQADALDASTLDEIETTRNQSGEKLRAANDGTEPPVTPMMHEIRPAELPELQIKILDDKKGAM